MNLYMLAVGPPPGPLAERLAPYLIPPGHSLGTTVDTMVIPPYFNGVAAPRQPLRPPHRLPIANVRACINADGPIGVGYADFVGLHDVPSLTSPIAITEAGPGREASSERHGMTGMAGQERIGKDAQPAKLYLGEID